MWLGVLREIVTFEDFRQSRHWLDLVVGILLLLCVIALVCCVGYVICWLGYTLYRLVAYDYVIETYSAKVTKREYKPEKMTYKYDLVLKMYRSKIQAAEYKVYFVTKNGLSDVIDDKELYYDVRKDSKIQVTMKVGRNRSMEPEIKYWRVIHYSW